AENLLLSRRARRGQQLQRLERHAARFDAAHEFAADGAAGAHNRHNLVLHCLLPFTLLRRPLRGEAADFLAIAVIARARRAAAPECAAGGAAGAHDRRNHVLPCLLPLALSRRPLRGAAAGFLLIAVIARARRGAAPLAPTIATTLFITFAFLHLRFRLIADAA